MLTQFMNFDIIKDETLVFNDLKVPIALEAKGDDDTNSSFCLLFC